MPITETAILERILEFEQAELPPEAARFFLAWDFPDVDRRRLRELETRAREGTLTTAEKADLDTYCQVADLLERMRVRARQVLSATLPAAAASPAASEIPEGIRRSQEAFWHALPELLKEKKNHGKWVCYHGDERIGIARTPEALIRECQRRGLQRKQYDLDVIEPRAIPPWEPEDVEPLGAWHDQDVPTEA